MSSCKDFFEANKGRMFKFRTKTRSVTPDDNCPPGCLIGYDEDEAGSYLILGWPRKHGDTWDIMPGNKEGIDPEFIKAYPYAWCVEPDDLEPVGFLN